MNINRTQRVIPTLAQWIPVSTGLPKTSERFEGEQSENVLVILTSEETDPRGAWMTFGRFKPGKGWEHDYEEWMFDGKVTHWAPRPDFPYEEA